jgi:hypothetical protein
VTIVGYDGNVDLLVEFEAGDEPGLLRLAGIETELSGPVGGRPVDLRTAQDLSHYFRDEVVRAAEVQYATRRCGSYPAHDRGDRVCSAFHHGATMQ